MLVFFGKCGWIFSCGLRLCIGVLLMFLMCSMLWGLFMDIVVSLMCWLFIFIL